MALDSGFITALLFLHFSVAFDCVHLSIFLQLLESQFPIMASTLRDRFHTLYAFFQTSKYVIILFVVPQGSILGPLCYPVNL